MDKERLTRSRRHRDAQCAQGIGDEVYHEYVKRFPCARSLKRDFEGNDFRMGAHKGYLFARATTRFQVAVHSELADTALHECLLSPGKLDKLIPAWLAKTPEARIAVIKNANSSFFYKE